MVFPVPLVLVERPEIPAMCKRTSLNLFWVDLLNADNLVIRMGESSGNEGNFDGTESVICRDCSRFHARGHIGQPKHV